jgi:pimeloyl-ACP methyl ester carboxylesterase
VLTERFAEVAGRRLRYLTGGRGTPLVLCHGFLSSAEEFGGRFEALAERRTLIVPDLPGNAASAPLAGRHTSEALAGAVDELLTRLGVEEFDLGGLCLGASVACSLARRRGESVGRLVLHTPLLTPGLIRARYRHQVSVLTLPGPWQAVIWLSRKRTVSDLYKRYIIREGPVDRRTSNINFENQRRAVPQAAREWIRDGLMRDDLDLVAARAKPTLIIIARNDGLVDVQGLQRVVERLPHVTMYVDDDSGHGWSEVAVRKHLGVLAAFFGNTP